jgi:hypothetical protein
VRASTAPRERGGSLWFCGERTEDQASDTADIALPAAQVRLAEAVAATRKPTNVVLVQGRPYALPDVIMDAAALIEPAGDGRDEPGSAQALGDLDDQRAQAGGRSDA